MQLRLPPPAAAAMFAAHLLLTSPAFTSPAFSADNVLQRDTPAFSADNVLQRDTVVKILEPNVVKLEKAGTVTLAGSSTPNKLPGCFAYNPAAAIRRSLPPKTAVDVETLPGKGSTGKSSTLAWIYRKEGALVQSTLVEGGWAKVVGKGNDPRLETLRKQQADAVARKVGLWVDCDALAAAELAGTSSDNPKVDFETQFEPLPGSDFEYGRIAARAVMATKAGGQPLTNPGDSKNCSDFQYFEEAKQFFDTYFPLYGDVAKLDVDNDLVPCPGLPHTPRRELYQSKAPSSFASVSPR